MNVGKYLFNSLSVLVVSVGLQVAHAEVSVVGTCQASRHTYSSITAAITAARSGDVIDVCPGTYAEQLTITKALTIRGITVADQPGVTITAPATGLQQLPAGSAFYPQVYVNHAGGAVLLSNLAVNGTGAEILYGTIAFDTTSACEIGFIKDFSGIYFASTPGEIKNVSISGHFVTSASPDNPGPQQYPDCGSGIEFSNHSETALVQDNVINGFGYTGISSTGPLEARRNVLTTQSGPYQVGIAGNENSVIAENTVSGVAFVQSVGIDGGSTVRDNIVQGFDTGIASTGEVVHNTLLNNWVGISSPGRAARNLITAPAQYNDPSCQEGSCGPGTGTLPTVGIDMQCHDSSMVTGNDVVGTGEGIANMEASESTLPSNLFAEVGVTSTSCAQTASTKKVR